MSLRKSPFCRTRLGLLWILIVSASYLDGTQPAAAERIPLGQNATFTCAETHPAWHFTFNNGDTAVGVVPALAGSGTFVFNDTRRIIFTFVEGIPSYSLSVLIIQASELNNGTLVRCDRHFSGVTHEGDREIEIQVFGPPPLPANLSAAPLGVRTLLISWLPSRSAFDIPVTYQMHVVGGQGAEKSATATNSTSIIFTHSRTYCGSFQFEVSSYNSAGFSVNSSMVTSPYLTHSNPEEVLNSVKLEVYLEDGGAILTISFEPPMFCPSYKQTAVFLHLAMLTPNSTSQVLALNTSALPARVGLMKNAKYKLSLFILENIDIAEKMDVYTTDVINPVMVLFDVQNQLIEVQCSFLKGSRAAGCIVEISTMYYRKSVPVKRVKSMALLHSTLPEGWMEGYNVSVVDWEEDKSQGNVRISVKIVNQSIMDEISRTTPDNSALLHKTKQDLVVGVVLGMLTLLTLVAVISLIFFAVLWYGAKNPSHGPKGKTLKGNANQISVNINNNSNTSLDTSTSVCSYTVNRLEEVNSCSGDGHTMTTVVCDDRSDAPGNGNMYESPNREDEVVQLECYDHINTITEQDQQECMYAEVYCGDPKDCTEVKNPLYDGLEQMESDTNRPCSDQEKANLSKEHIYSAVPSKPTALCRPPLPTSPKPPPPPPHLAPVHRSSPPLSPLPRLSPTPLPHTSTPPPQTPPSSASLPSSPLPPRYDEDYYSRPRDCPILLHYSKIYQ